MQNVAVTIIINIIIIIMWQQYPTQKRYKSDTLIDLHIVYLTVQFGTTSSDLADFSSTRIITRPLQQLSFYSLFYNHCCLVRINKWMDGLPTPSRQCSAEYIAQCHVCRPMSVRTSSWRYFDQTLYVVLDRRHISFIMKVTGSQASNFNFHLCHRLGLE